MGHGHQPLEITGGTRSTAVSEEKRAYQHRLRRNVAAENKHVREKGQGVHSGVTDVPETATPRSVSTAIDEAADTKTSPESTYPMILLDCRHLLAN